MHSAPSVSFPVVRPLFAGLLAAGVWSGGVAVTLWWLYEADAPGWRLGAAALALAVSGAWALASWLHSPVGNLHWDGAGWSAPSATQPGTVAVAMDLQQVLLVRWHGPQRAQWFWLERQSCPQRWLDLRRAVYSRATSQALPPARPPAPTP